MGDSSNTLALPQPPSSLTFSPTATCFPPRLNHDHIPVKWFSKGDLQTSRLSIASDLLEIQIWGLSPKPIESETLSMKSSNSSIKPFRWFREPLP